MSLIQNIKSYSESIPLSLDKKKELDLFFIQGFPTTKNEEWKYTSLKKIIEQEFLIEKKGNTLTNDDIFSYSLGFENKIVFVDGILHSSPKIKGLEISGFSEFNNTAIDAIAHLNSSLASKGFTIHVKKNCILENPIEILIFNTVENNFNQYRNIISVEENSEVKFVERIQNIYCNTSFLNNFTQIHCKSNSKVEYNIIENNTEQSKLINSIEIMQQQDSVCVVNTLIFGGTFVRNNLNFVQNEKNCESKMNGISILTNDQFADNHTLVEHKSANCFSNELYKGIYSGNARGVFNGKIMVRPDAQKINAFQANNNLLLSENASIDSKPQLEIYADDVKCSHGCTVGQLDEEALFYMRSRGIALEEAKAVLTYAFASEVIDSFSIEKVKELAKTMLSKKLNVELDFSL